MTTPVSVRTVAPAAPVSGPPVLFVHGFTSSCARDFPDDLWAEPLAAAGRAVFLIDLPGHGAAPRLDGPIAPSAVVDALLGVADDAGGVADIIGYSLGGRLAWDAAGRPGSPIRRAVLGGVSETEPFAHVDVAAARAAGAGDGDGDGLDPLTRVILSMTRGPGVDGASLLDLVEGFGAQPFVPATCAPTGPVLLVAGEDDGLAQGVESLAAPLPDARVLRVPGDHEGALHDPVFPRAALAFVSG